MQLSEEAKSQFKAACTASEDGCATQKSNKKKRKAAESAKAKIAELGASCFADLAHKCFDHNPIHTHHSVSDVCA